MVFIGAISKAGEKAKASKAVAAREVAARATAPKAVASQAVASQAVASKAEASKAEASKAEATKAKTVTKPQKSKGASVWKDLLSLLLKIASILIAFVLLFSFVFGITRFTDPSMDPAIKDGDLIIFYRHASRAYEPGDVIALMHDGQIQVRRVIATAGDTVDITKDGLVINGALQQEIGIYRETQRYQSNVSFPLTVPEGHVFVLGDNRTSATDSRIFDCIKTEDTLGKAMTVIRHWGI
jgi:signal peptidase I